MIEVTQARCSQCDVRNVFTSELAEIEEQLALLTERRERVSALIDLQALIPVTSGVFQLAFDPVFVRGGMSYVRENSPVTEALKLVC